uniref:Uncharacterized protein n=1 Tax=Glossina austeni TaxID=7395 RepID=A0A1A9UUY0_GLOAU
MEEEWAHVQFPRPSNRCDVRQERASCADHITPLPNVYTTINPFNSEDRQTKRQQTNQAAYARVIIKQQYTHNYGAFSSDSDSNPFKIYVLVVTVSILFSTTC